MAQSTNPLPFLRGIAWTSTGVASYPRADPSDFRRLPSDTWAEAQIPVGIRLEMIGDAGRVEVHYLTTTDELGFRGPGAGRTFAVWRDGELVDEQQAVLGSGVVRLDIGDGLGRATVYLPEGMKPIVSRVEAVDGFIEPAPPQPRWLAYGDSITAGWSASSPAAGWVATAGREQSLDAVNLGYAGSARGEIVSAQQIAAIPADVISLTYGTNCWGMVPHSVDMLRASTEAFLRIIRSQHGATPIVVVSPLCRPDAEDQLNLLGATLADLREAMEAAADAVSDPLVTCISGRDLLAVEMLSDGVHPGDAGHRVLATVLGRVVSDACRQGGISHQSPTGADGPWT